MEARILSHLKAPPGLIRGNSVCTSVSRLVSRFTIGRIDGRHERGTSYAATGAS